ncbi:MAG: 2-oxoglutarate dehydrogenase E1 component [Verrucomicrobiota bacterium]
MKPTASPRFNADLLDENYALWLDDPGAVDSTWSAFFEGFELGMSELKKKNGAVGTSQTVTSSGEPRITQTNASFRARLVSMVYTFRTLGHTEAFIDPLSKEPPVNPRLSLNEFGFEKGDLDREVATQFFANAKPMKLREMIGLLRETYCGFTGYEFMHIYQTDVRNWLRDRIEAHHTGTPPDSTLPSREAVFQWLLEAEIFETFLHRKYVGQKRFGLEGGESTLVALNTILNASPGKGISEIVMGMAHRGRLSVLANFLKKPLSLIFHEFSENYVPDLVGGDGDVKYHLGFDTVRPLDEGEVSIILAPNPSHLEAVNPVVEGMARARQRLRDDMHERASVLPILLHGDAAFAGQGSVAEVLNFSQLPGYRTGGTIHLVINNQIGFTTMPADARSSVYCTDVAKMIEAPIFHVNGDCPMEVARVAKLALDYRQKFGRDVVIDLVCYRRYGHNEADEPAFTQPKIYKKIRSKASTATLFRASLVEDGAISNEQADAVAGEISTRMETDYESVKADAANGIRTTADHRPKNESQPEYTFDTGKTALTPDLLREYGQRLVDVPEGFKVNDKLQRLFLFKRGQATENGGPYDWAHAEALAFAGLVAEGHPVRLSGQDIRRGTFSHRHAVLYDMETRERWMPLEHITGDQAKFRAYNSLLSEAGVLGFDYGYSLMIPEMLICWEAQFGDFANGAQVIVDQFITSAETKWDTPSSITLLLPHGYEGQGPEHSSGRIERFLQLCADKNMQVCNLTKPAQYFHLLRRQVKRPFRKPLILFTPKSLLRNEACVSHEADFTGDTHFHEIIDDDQLVMTPDRVTRLIFCSGKVYYDLLKYRNENKLKNAAIIRIEQLYPFNGKLFEEIVSRYERANKKWVWCQEEPLNQGAWSYIWPRLERYTTHMQVRYAGRERSASTATGAKAIHLAEQRKLVEDAFSV